MPTYTSLGAGNTDDLWAGGANGANTVAVLLANSSTYRIQLGDGRVITYSGNFGNYSFLAGVGLFPTTGTYTAITTQAANGAVTGTLTGFSDLASRIYAGPAVQALSVLGGDDTININSSNQTLPQILRGHDGNDTFVYSSNTLSSYYVGAGTVFDGGAGTDTLSLRGNMSLEFGNVTFEGIDVVRFLDGPAANVPTSQSLHLKVSSFSGGGGVVAFQQSATSSVSSLFINNASASSVSASSFDMTGWTFDSPYIYLSYYGDQGTAETVNGSNAAYATYQVQTNDIIVGGSGSDTFYFYSANARAQGNGSFDGGQGNDSISLGTRFLDINLASISSIETISMDSDSSLTLNGQAAGMGLASNLNLIGGSNSILTLNMNLYTVLNMSSWQVGTSQWANDARIVVVGNSNTETITGSSADDFIIGGGGADILNGGANRAGGDWLSYSTSVNGVNVTLGDGSGPGTNSGGDAAGDITSNFENLIGSNAVDTLTGNSGNNTIIGGGGADSINGGSGNDTVSYVNANRPVRVSLAAGSSQSLAGDSAGDTFTSIENFIGSAVNDQLTGDSFVNILNGGLGNDTLIGGASGDTLIGGGGVDTVSYQTSIAAVQISLSAVGAQTSTGDGSGDTLTGITNLIGSTQGDNLTGSAADNVINGNGGNDTIFGLDGNDTIVFNTGLLAANVNGGIGTDTLLINGSAVPTSFNLVTAGLEQAKWVGSNANSTTTDIFNSAWQKLTSSVDYNNGTRSDTAFDVAGTQNYSSTRNDYNANDQRTFNRTIYDTGGGAGKTIDTYYDVAETQNYLTQRTDTRTSDGAVLYSSIVYDAGPGTGKTIETYYDIAGTQNYISQRTDKRTSDGAVSYTKIVYDTGPGAGKTIDTYYDIAGTQEYSSQRTDTRTSDGATVFTRVIYDSGPGVGKTIDTAFDVGGTQNYASTRTDYRTSDNAVVFTRTYYDAGPSAGTRWDVTLDPDNLQTWNQHIQIYNSAGTLISDYFV